MIRAIQIGRTTLGQFLLMGRSVFRATLSGEENEVRLRRLHLVGALGFVGHPLYFFVWSWLFPQRYENGWLRVGCALLFLPLLFMRRLEEGGWRRFYPFIAITAGLPFSFVFLYLQNAGAMVWAESVLIAVVILFHFSTTFALASLILGTASGAIAFEIVGGSFIGFPWHETLIQLPILGFEIAALVIIKLDRRALTEQKQRGATVVLGIMAHELRTPLASIELTMRGVQSRVQRSLSTVHPPEWDDLPRAIERVRAEVVRMNNTIELLLTNSKAPESLPVESFSPDAVIRSTVDAFPFEAGLAKLVHLERCEVVSARGNAALFGHVITNLLKNSLEAIQRAGKGEIIISCNRTASGVKILFQDTGAGMSPNTQKRVFEPFFSYPTHRGTGIGLSFCRTVIHSWGGTIDCASVEGEYTEFRVHLLPAQPDVAEMSLAAVAADGLERS